MGEETLGIAGTTLSSNDPLAVDGHTPSSGSAGIIVDRTLIIALPSDGSQTSPASLTLGSQTLTASEADAASPSEIVVGIPSCRTEAQLQRPMVQS